MGKKESYEDEEMTVELELEDGTVVNCAIITILTVEAKDYIVLLPLDEDGEKSAEDAEEKADEEKAMEPWRTAP